MDYEKGNLLPDEISRELRDQFYYVDSDPYIGDRLFFENSGGSLRLKAVVDAYSRLAPLPDCSLRDNETAKVLAEIQRQGIEDIRCLFNAKNGIIYTTYTASMAMFEMVRTIAENIPGKNIVTTSLEHPSAFDSCEYYAEKLGKELRVAYPNSVTGAIEIEAIESLVDEDTVLLSFMAASNITGANMDIEGIVKAARAIKPDLFILVDGVQYAAHGLIDVEKMAIDGMNIAPYKFFGNRGAAFAYISDRMSILPHHKLTAKKADDWELGSPTPADYASFSEVVNYICRLGEKFSSSGEENRRKLLEKGMNVIKYQEQALLERMLKGSDEVPGLRDLSGVTVHFDAEDLSKRSLILGITFEEFDCTTATRKYREKGIIVFERLASSPYSKRILESFDLTGVVRVSPLHCNNKEDIDAFLLATKEIISEAAHLKATNSVCKTT